MKRLIPLILCFFAFPLWADDFDMRSYLKSLNNYYYCFPRAGIKSFQAQAVVSFSGQPPKKIAEALKGMDWPNDHARFDFTYVGSGVVPILSFSSNGGDPAATPEKMRSISDLSNVMLGLWGLFMCNDFYDPPSSKVSYRVAHDPGAAFAILRKEKKSTLRVDYDDRSLAKKLTVTDPGSVKNIPVHFFLSTQGALPDRIGLEIKGDRKTEPTAMDIVLQYQLIQGFLLPSSIIVYERSPGQLFQMTFALSNYAIQKVKDLPETTDQGDTQIVPASSEAEGAKHFFWRVTSPTAVVYLLGSIHIRSKAPLQVPEVVEKGFEESLYVGFEYDLTKQAEVEREYPQYVREHYSYPAGDSLPNHLTLAQWKTIRRIAAKVHVPLADIQQLRPFMVDDYLGREGNQKGDEDLKQNGIDFIFLRKALAARKPVFGMEFWYEPFKVLNDLREPEQVYYLFGSSVATTNQVRFMDEIFADWKTGNTLDLGSLTYSGLAPDDMAIMDAIVKTRNEVWVPQMERILRSGATYFIVVGSAHLVGEYGLPSLLAKKGYKVEQL